MSNHDQCPTTTKGEKQQPGKAELAALARVAGTTGGQVAGRAGERVWRSFEDLADTSEFRDWMEREFPEGYSEMRRAEDQDGVFAGAEADDAAASRTVVDAPVKNSESRRDFLKLMGASAALAGAAMIPGCRRPDHKILPYGKHPPEEMIPGKPLFYATSWHRPDGGAEGLLVETHEGRPTKIEGNPLHAYNQGKASSWAMSSIMTMYDPDRLKQPEFNNPNRGKVAASWDDFRTWAATNLANADKVGGEGIAFIVEKKNSPTRDDVKKQLLTKWPKATWVAYSPFEAVGEAEGTRIAFGSAMRAVFNFSKDTTNVIVSLDRDFLHQEAASLISARSFASTRAVMSTKDSMSRLYMVESGFSTTGAAADHRLRLGPARVAAFAVALAKAVLPKLGDSSAGALQSALEAVSIPAGADLDDKSAKVFLDECVQDLLDAANRGKTLIVAGPTQPPAVHAVVAALNSAMASKAVTYYPLSEEDATGSLSALAALVGRMQAGEIKCLVCVETNPAYDAPGDLKFLDAWKKVPATITLSVGQSETAAASTWSLNAAHYLESWGDARAIDGTISPIQPMIAPLFEPAMSDVEFLALLGGKDFTARIDGYEIVRNAWRKQMSGVEGGFDKVWRRALHDGIVPGTAAKASSPKADLAKIVPALKFLPDLSMPTQDKLDVAFVVGNVGDGRFANVAWLHELPEFGTRVVWDNPALVSPSTAKALGLLPGSYSDSNPSGVYTKEKWPQGRMATITVNGRSMEMPVWILPGMADNTVLLTVGYGREKTGLVGDGVGFNVYPLRGAASGGVRMARGATASALSSTHFIASTQNHWTIEGRTSILRMVDLECWKKHGDFQVEWKDAVYLTENKLNFAEALGELSHTPPNLSSYENPYNKGKGDPSATNITPGDPNGPAYQRNQPPVFSGRMQWGMTIDQSACTGCGACTIACQSENNIPVVGKKETAKGREMAWIRVDRYFMGDDMNNPSAMVHQPVACVHCENAPCEVVCPVSATIHGPEGLNYMTYNRCIGTRYCANNCPYKVRRYNFFEYGKLKFNGGYIGQDTMNSVADYIPTQGEGPNGSKVHNKININLIPPRLRDKLDQISQMQKNPDVSVRMRGVMEKCTYCIQRINYAKIECKLHDLKDEKGAYVIPDGFVQAACQQACPSHAIEFGDINDVQSKVHTTRKNARSYALLGYLNTRPRTSHMVRVVNPNPRILAVLDPERIKSWEHPFHLPVGAGGHDGHGGEHGSDGHGTDGHEKEKPAEGAKHSFRYDPRKRREDGGYALSLSVLGANGGMA